MLPIRLVLVTDGMDQFDRAMGAVQASPELVNDAAAFQRFQQAQGQLTGALSRLMAVSENYPLRGALRIAPGLNTPDEKTQAVPREGEAWPDERLATALNLSQGSRLALGNAHVNIGVVHLTAVQS